MIYEAIDRGSVLNWIADKQKLAPAPIWELETTSETYVRVLQSPVGGLQELFHLRSDSGALEVNFSGLADFTPAQMTQLSLLIASVFDSRDFYRWEELDEEEGGAPSGINRAVIDELWGSIDGVRPVGPGGRVTIYGSQRRVDIVLRHRVRPLGGYWRPPGVIAEAVNDLFGEESAPDARLRASLGYFEASKFDRQRYLRPAFVFLLDRPMAGEGPRWRVATVTAATAVDVLPLTAGLETAASGCP